MALFLTAQQLYKLFNRELPPNSYATGEYSQSESGASIYAKARVLEKYYKNLGRIWANLFPQSADEQIDDWVTKCFGQLFPGGTTLTYKQQACIQQIRSQPNLTLWQILTNVAQLVPYGTYVQIWPRNTVNPGWQLGVSKLGTSTYLSGADTDSLSGYDFANWGNDLPNFQWRLGQGKLGTSTALGKYLYTDIVRRQLNAYAYEVRIFGLTLSASLYSQIDTKLNQSEPARSLHLIRDNLNLADFGLTVPVANVGQFSLVNCITRDQTQSTGYSGLTTGG